MLTFEQIEQRAFEPGKKYPVNIWLVSQMDDGEYFREPKSDKCLDIKEKYILRL